MNNTRQRRPALPANCPRLIRLTVERHMFRGKPQWQGTYRFYYNNLPSDWMTVVVNETRRARPRHGEEWWVEPIPQELKMRIVFANAIRKAEMEQVRPSRRAPQFGDDLDFWRMLLFAEFKL